jgi:hypothetical protein
MIGMFFDLEVPEKAIGNREKGIVVTQHKAC